MTTIDINPLAEIVTKCLQGKKKYGTRSTPKRIEVYEIQTSCLAIIPELPVGYVSFSPQLDKIIVEAAAESGSGFSGLQQNNDTIMKPIAQEIEAFQERQKADLLPTLPVFYMRSIKPENAQTGAKYNYF